MSYVLSSKPGLLVVLVSACFLALPDQWRLFLLLRASLGLRSRGRCVRGMSGAWNFRNRIVSL